MSRLAKSFALFLSFAGLLLGATNANAVPCTSVATGNWSAKTTWGTALNGCVGAGTGVGETAGIPGVNDTVTIAAAHTVTVTANAAATSITIAAPSVAHGININPGIALNVSGAITMTAPAANFASTLAVGSGTLTAASIAINGGTAGTRISQVTVSTGTITVTGAVTRGGTAAQSRFIATGASTITVGGAFSPGAFTPGASTLTVSGNFTPTAMVANTGTVILTGGAAQSMGAFTTYNNVTINKTVGTIATLAGNTSMTGALTVTSGTLNKNTRTLGVAGNLAVNGVITGTSGNITLSGAAATIDGTGTITTTTGLLSITAAKSILATANLTIASPITITGAITVTNNGTVNKTTTTAINGSVAGSTWLNAANSTLNYAGTNAPMVMGVLTASAANTVNYNGAAQTVEVPSGAPATYYHLTLSGSGVKTMPATAMTVTGNFTMSGTATTAPTGALTVGGNFIIGTGTTFTAGNFNHTVSGNFDATGTFTSTGSTVTLNGATAQTISGTNPVAFNILAVSAVSPNITLATNVTVATLTGTVTLTPSCPDYTLTSTTPAQVLHSCPSPPTVTTNAATALTASGATLNGTVSSNGAITTVTFDYGTTIAYGSSATATQSPLAANAVNTAVSAAVTGLACNTLYHFRVIGNGAGTTNGNDLTFTTSACPTVVINTYYPGTASVAAGATSITLGAATGAATPIAIGDLLLIMQMQDATIDSTNMAIYGTVSAANAGLYEYAIAANAVPLGGGALSLLPCGIINAYTNADYVAGSGQKRFQVIRVPVYASYTINAITALAWNGSTGGVLAFDVTGALNLNTATVDVSGMGFRGGASRMLAGPGATGANTDYVTLATVNNNASKGEGIAGTPQYVFTAPSTLTNTGVEGYPNGSHARGAPANGGGGGTDGSPTDNQENTGGGGGANAGVGGMGGIGWCGVFNALLPPNYNCSNSGGVGGYAVTGLGATRLTLGGGGGGATTNNGTGTPAAGLASSGAAGGGSIMIRADSFTGSATFNANGSAANNTVGNDGSGGGGAGGTVMLLANSGMAGATINVTGGMGGTNLIPPLSSGPHGPGGGGGGGYAITSAATAACNNGGGINGVTYNNGALFGAYGSTPGSAGSCATGLTAAQIPGTRLGATSCGPDHYELSLPTSGITCLPVTATVTACADSSSPCTSPFITVSGQTATLATSAGTLVPTTVTFNASGVASTTLSYPAAIDGAAASVTLSGEQTAATSARKCCPDGVNCVVANSCSTTFNTAGFVFSSSAGGGVVTIPNQVAGVSDGTYYLRAVKTLDNSSHTCGAALSGAQTVNFAYECNDPTTCYAADLMSVNGGSSTTITRNNNGSVSSYTPVNMTFDANGNAPFTFIYSDVGLVKLWANKTVNSALLTGSSNSFVVKPYGFTVTGIMRTSDSFANPAAADATGTAFIKAGASFTATVTATASGGAATPNYGKESTPEGVKLTAALAPGLGLSNLLTLTNDTIAGSEFGSGGIVSDANGVATVTNLAWNEVGIIRLTPSVADANYLGAGDVTGTTSGNVGRFYPDHFTLSLPPDPIAERSDVSPACSPASIFTYMNEPFQAAFTLTAKGPAPGNATLLNYVTSATPANNFAQLATATPIPAGFGFAYLDGTTNLTSRMDSSLGITGSWTAGELAATATLAFTRDTAPDGPFNAMKVGIAPVDSDVVALSAFDMDVTAPAGNDHAEVGQTQIRYGRLRLINAYGSELLEPRVEYRAEYWDGSRWATNTDDRCSAIADANIAIGNAGTLTLTPTVSSITQLADGTGGVGFIIFNKTNQPGSFDIALDMGGGTGNTLTAAAACESAGWAPNLTNGANLSYLAGMWCGSAFDKYPAARIKLGSPKAPYIYLRERY